MFWLSRNGFAGSSLFFRATSRPEVVAVRGPDPCASLGLQVIGIDFAAREGLHRRPDPSMDTGAGAPPASHGPSRNGDPAPGTTAIFATVFMGLGAFIIVTSRQLRAQSINQRTAASPGAIWSFC